MNNRSTWKSQVVTLTFPKRSLLVWKQHMNFRRQTWNTSLITNEFINSRLSDFCRNLCDGKPLSQTVWQSNLLVHFVVVKLIFRTNFEIQHLGINKLWTTKGWRKDDENLKLIFITLLSTIKAVSYSGRLKNFKKFQKISKNLIWNIKLY